MRILIAIDGSEHSNEAVEMVGSRPWPQSTTVQVMSVVPKPSIIPPPPPAVVIGRAIDPAHLAEEQKAAARSLVDSACERLRQRGVTATGYVRVGEPASTIVDSAREWSADLIVVGSRGLTGIKRVLLGSVALHVATHAPCSVEVVHKKARAA